MRLPGKILSAGFIIVVITVSLPYLYDWWLWRHHGNSTWEYTGEEEYIAFAPAFTHEGLLSKNAPAPVDEIVVEPGPANQMLANWLKESRETAYTASPLSNRTCPIKAYGLPIADLQIKLKQVVDNSQLCGLGREYSIPDRSL